MRYFGKSPRCRVNLPIDQHCATAASLSPIKLHELQELSNRCLTIVVLLHLFCEYSEGVRAHTVYDDDVIRVCRGGHPHTHLVTHIVLKAGKRQLLCKQHIIGLSRCRSQEIESLVKTL